MKDHIDIGSSPSEEDCAQVGQKDYADQARLECHTFIEQLRRMFGKEPEGANLAIKSNPHDFGTYLSVVCYFDDASEEATKYAFKLESETPAEWDERSKKYLKWGVIRAL